MPNSIFESIVGVTKEYLGPASERFVRRQIGMHLERDVDTLTKKDVSSVAEWVGTGIGLITQSTDDVSAVKEKINKIQ